MSFHLAYHFEGGGRGAECVRKGDFRKATSAFGSWRDALQ
jgi:hypothetical protein